MNSQTDQLQTIITEIEKTLSKASPNLPWVMSGTDIEQRQVLEKVRNYLLFLHRSTAMPDSAQRSQPEQQALMGQLPYPKTDYGQISPVVGEPETQQAAQQILQAVMAEMGQLRAGLTHPLQADVERLQQQRAALQEEIKQLESQRQSYWLTSGSSQQLTPELIQSLIGRLQETLAQQIAWMQAYLPSPAGNYPPGASPALPASASPGSIAVPTLSEASQHLEKLRTIQTKSDQVLMALDSTINIVFEALQKNVETYKDSLGQGLEKMYSLGHQGEMMFTAWMTLLIQQLAREPASYLQAAYAVGRSSTGLAGGNANTPNLATGSSALDGLTPETQHILNQFGISLPSPSETSYRVTPDSVQPGGGRSMSPPDVNRFDLEDLDLEDLDLSDLQFDPFPDADNVVSGTSDLPDLTDVSAMADMPEMAQDVADVQRSNNQVITDWLEQNQSARSATPSKNDLDSALDFLEQLSAALQDQETIAELDAEEEALAPVSADSSSDGDEVHQRSQPADLMQSGIPELDEFYHNLFGEADSTPETDETEHPLALEDAPVEDIPVEDASIVGSTEGSVSQLSADDPAEAFIMTSAPLDELERLDEEVITAPQDDEPGFLTEPPLFEGGDLFAGLSDPAGQDVLELEVPPLVLTIAATNESEAQILLGQAVDGNLASTQGAVLGTTDGEEAVPNMINSQALDERFLQLGAIQSEALVDLSDGDSLDLFEDFLGTNPDFSTIGSDLEAQGALSSSSNTDISPLSVNDQDISGDDQFIPAAPEENLLFTDEAEMASNYSPEDLGLWLDSTTLQHLSEDLSSLENLPYRASDQTNQLQIKVLPTPSDQASDRADDTSVSRLQPELSAPPVLENYPLLTEPEQGRSHEPELLQPEPIQPEPEPVVDSITALFSDEVVAPSSLAQGPTPETDSVEQAAGGASDVIPDNLKSLVRDLFSSLTGDELAAVSNEPITPTQLPREQDEVFPSLDLTAPTSDPRFDESTTMPMDTLEDFFAEEAFASTTSDSAPPDGSAQATATGDELATMPMMDTLDDFFAEEAFTSTPIDSAQQDEPAQLETSAPGYTPAPVNTLESFFAEDFFADQVPSSTPVEPEITSPVPTIVPSSSEQSTIEDFFADFGAADVGVGQPANESIGQASEDLFGDFFQGETSEKKKILTDEAEQVIETELALGSSRGQSPSDIEEPAQEMEGELTLDMLQGLIVDGTDQPEAVVETIQVAESFQTEAWDDRETLPQFGVARLEEEPDEQAIAQASVEDLETPAPSLNSGGSAPKSIQEVTLPTVWYLGLDLGETGISAVLLNRQTNKMYPICWQLGDAETADGVSFRLPAMAYLPGGPDAAPLGTGFPTVAYQHFLQDREREVTGFLVQHWKPYLKAVLPYQASQATGESPTFQWSPSSTLSLHQLQTVLETLLNTLTSPELGRVSATGLDRSLFETAIYELAGVVVGYPHNWPDTYSFNLREVILKTGLVDYPDQILFMEEAIATVLSGLPACREALQLGTRPDRLQKSMAWRGSTLVISSGAIGTDIGVVFLPENLAQLSHADFKIRRLAYGGKALDQDILCHIIEPEYRQQQTIQPEPASLADLGLGSDRPTSAGTGQAFPHFTLATDGTSWSELGLADFDRPAVGEPDLQTRLQIQQRLEGSVLGKSLLEAAQYAKLVLQSHDRLTLELGNQTWVITRRQLESQIFLPFIQRLNRELNTLLSQAGFIPQAINQAVCTGGTASLPAIARWLRQKLPNATIIQDTYPTEGTPLKAIPEKGFTLTTPAPICSRVAYGLATLPLYPQVLEVSRQQYSDYFLLSELLNLVTDLRTTANGPISLSRAEVMRLLEQRGINTHACELHLLALLEGHLPPGLVPSTVDTARFSPTSLTNPLYQNLTQNPLFTKPVEASQGAVYVPNFDQCDRVRSCLIDLLANTQQTLKEPLTMLLLEFS